MPYSRIKYIIDFISSIGLLLFFTPVLVIISIFLAVSDDITFRQIRVGKEGKKFQIYKFKTINLKGRSSSFQIFLRKSGLDELPQLVNVLKGDMSLIGPRPLLIEYQSHLSQKELKRNDVKPGISGWVQVNGGNYLSWSKRFELDLYYIENQSFKLDFYILLKTVFYWLKKWQAPHSSDSFVPKITIEKGHEI